MKILYITRDIGHEKNGANQVMGRNLRVLKEIVGKNNVVEYYLPKTNIRNVLGSLIRMGSYGVPKVNEIEISSVIERNKPDIAFIESSAYGSIYRMLHKKKVKTICFAHNLDTALCKQELSSRSPLISFPKLLSTYYNERRAAKYADCLICLNERDSKGFLKTFRRKADQVIPITFPSKSFSQISSSGNNKSPYFLFVGSDFFPNVEGIKWFITKVAPFVEADFRIVGSCCVNPAIRSLMLPQNVSLVGYAEDIGKEYRDAIGVIAPIFKGSGMKTKTIEALSYGKSIFGTSEAFAGIELDYAKVGGLCEDDQGFINALNDHQGGTINKYSFEVFQSSYSDEYFKKQLKIILEGLSIQHLEPKLV